MPLNNVKKNLTILSNLKKKMNAKIFYPSELTKNSCWKKLEKLKKNRENSENFKKLLKNSNTIKNKTVKKEKEKKTMLKLEN